METIAERMRALRMKWGKSARSLSQELGLNVSSWGVYEAGTSVPGGEVLALLAHRNVDINWLLTGNIYRPGGDDVTSVLAQIEAREHRSLGIGHLSVMATRANVTLKAKLLTLLAQSRTPMTLEEVVVSSNEEQSTVVVCLVELLKQGQILEVVDDTGVGKYRLRTSFVVSATQSLPDNAAITLEAIKFLANDVYEGIQKTPGETLLISVSATVKDGQKFLERITDSLKEHVACEGVAPVKFVFAAKAGM